MNYSLFPLTAQQPFPIIQNGSDFRQWLESTECWPIIRSLKEVAERLEYHPEGTTGNHLEAIFNVYNTEKIQSSLIVLALLGHDLGKSITGGTWPWPNGNLESLGHGVHHGHDDLSVTLIESLHRELELLKYNEWSFDQWNFVKAFAQFHQRIHGLSQNNIKAALRCVEAIKSHYGWSDNPCDSTFKYWDLLGQCCELDSRGRWGFESSTYSQRQLLNLLISGTYEYKTQVLPLEAKIRSQQSIKRQTLFLQLKDQTPNETAQSIHQKITILLQSEFQPTSLESFLRSKIQQSDYQEPNPDRKIRPAI